ALPDHYGRMDTHPQHRRMETTPGTRAGQTPHPLPFPRLPLIRRGARIGLAASALAILAACAGTGPEGLKIDRSHQAVSQSSRAGFVVLHYTNAHTERALDILTTRNVSSHYLVTDDDPPIVYQLVDEDRQAWHAGESEWYGRTYLNASSIGIEIVNAGPRGDGWEPYPDSQIEAVIALVKDIVTRHQIQARNVVGHSDIAPGRKQDPGPAFPWKRLADAGVGRWYDEAKAQGLTERYRRTGLPPMGVIQEKLRRAGYAAPDTGTLDAAT